MEVSIYHLEETAQSKHDMISDPFIFEVALQGMSMIANKSGSSLTGHHEQTFCAICSGALCHSELGNVDQVAKCNGMLCEIMRSSQVHSQGPHLDLLLKNALLYGMRRVTASTA